MNVIENVLEYNILKGFWKKFVTHEMETTVPLTDLLRIEKISSVDGVLSLTKALVSRGVSMPGLLFKKATSLLRSKGGSLGDEKWTILERVLLAAIKLDIEPWIGYCLKELRGKFPGSTRVQRLVWCSF